MVYHLSPPGSHSMTTLLYPSLSRLRNAETLNPLVAVTGTDLKAPGFRSISATGFMVQFLGFVVWGSGFRVWVLGRGLPQGFQVFAVARVSFCQSWLYQGVLDRGHRGPSCSLVQSFI